MKQLKKPTPSRLWRRGRQGAVVCQCGARRGSEYDGLCTTCRGGVTAFEAKAGRRPCRSPYCECDFGACTHPGCYDARHEKRTT